MTARRLIPTQREVTRALAVVAVILVVLLFVGWLVGQRPAFLEGLDCAIEEVNIKTGQLRYRRVKWWREQSVRLEETAVSKALAGETVGVAPDNAWHPVNTHRNDGAPSAHHGRYRRAIVQVRTLGNLWDRGGYTPEQRRDSARELLRAWQATGSGSGANEHIQRLEEAIRVRRKGLAF